MNYFLGIFLILLIFLFSSHTNAEYKSIDLGDEYIYVENVDNFDNFERSETKFLENNSYRLDIELKKGLTCNIDEIMDISSFKDFRKRIIETHTKGDFSKIEDIKDEMNNLEVEIKKLESEYNSLGYYDNLIEYEITRDLAIEKYKKYLGYVNNYNNLNDDLATFENNLLEECKDINENFNTEKEKYKLNIEKIKNNLIDSENNFDNKEEFKALINKSEDTLDEIENKGFFEEYTSELRQRIKDIKKDFDSYNEELESEMIKLDNDDNYIEETKVPSENVGLSESKKKKIKNVVVFLENKNPNLINDLYIMVGVLKNNYKEGSKQFLILDSLEIELSKKVNN